MELESLPLKTDNDMNQRWKAMTGVVCVLSLTGAVFAQKQTLPDGKGKAELIHSCTACHDTNLVVRVKKTPEDWKKTVYEMADRGVDASDEELDTIVRYLSTNFGLEKSTATAAHAAAGSAAPARPAR
jgi:Quinohemoprotein amine dehydrogenase A, alpha subunit, haem binding